MTWQGKRRASLPRNWTSLRASILRRDPTCKLALPVCAGRSTEVDHIGAADDHRPDMLRGVCRPCHKKRTQNQAQAANPTVGRRRAPRRHPSDFNR